MTNNRTMERQNAVKSVSQIFQGHGKLSDEEERQAKRLIQEFAEFNKKGSFRTEEVE
jgi:hypothetical protein